jgi:hypothetical protein
MARYRRFPKDLLIDLEVAHPCPAIAGAGDAACNSETRSGRGCGQLKRRPIREAAWRHSRPNGISRIFRRPVPLSRYSRRGSTADSGHRITFSA